MSPIFSPSSQAFFARTCCPSRYQSMNCDNSTTVSYSSLGKCYSFTLREHPRNSKPGVCCHSLRALKAACQRSRNEHMIHKTKHPRNPVSGAPRSQHRKNAARIAGSGDFVNADLGGTQREAGDRGGCTGDGESLDAVEHPCTRIDSSSAEW